MDNNRFNPCEKLGSLNLSDAALSFLFHNIDELSVFGRYHAQLIGPKEIYRDDYIELRHRQHEFIMLGDDAKADEIARLMRTMEEFKWDEDFPNLVTTAGKNLMLDSFLAGSSYTVTGPFIGLINSNASSAVVGDTMSSHSGWLEVGGTNAPTYTSPRKTAAWASATGGSKSLSSPASFAILSSGTVGGCFMVLGSGASSSIDNTSGTLFSAGAFTGGNKTVANGDTLNVSYSCGL